MQASDWWNADAAYEFLNQAYSILPNSVQNLVALAQEKFLDSLIARTL